MTYLTKNDQWECDLASNVFFLSLAEARFIFLKCLHLEDLMQK